MHREVTALRPTSAIALNQTIALIEKQLDEIGVHWENVHFDWISGKLICRNGVNAQQVKAVIQSRLVKMSSELREPLEFNEFLQLFSIGAEKYKYSRLTETPGKSYRLPLPYAGIKQMSLLARTTAPSQVSIRMAIELLVYYAKYISPVALPQDGKFCWKVEGQSTVVYRDWLS